MKRMSRVIAVPCERIRLSLSVRESRGSGEGGVRDMIVGTSREIDTAIIKDDIVFVRVLSNARYVLL